MEKVEFPAAYLWAARLLVLAAFVLLPLCYAQKYVIHVLGLAMIFAIAALALQLLLGFAGLLSIGQAAFLGIGAYTSALLTTTAGAPFEVGFLAAGLLCGLTSLTLVPITRLRGVYLGVATLGFTIIVHLVILNEEWLTGGSFGLLRIPAPSLGPWRLRGEVASYYLCLAVLVLTFVALHRLLPSRFGRALQAIRLDEEAARTSGINITYYKSQAFVVASVITGFAGSLFAHHALYLNPNDFTFWKSIEILIMVAVGGMGSLAGAVVGAFAVVLLPEYLRAVDEFRMLIFGGLLIVLMGLGHNGVAGFAAAIAVRLWRRRARAKPASLRVGAR
jgi:branched-chain amino acid transport system permease protein